MSKLLRMGRKARRMSEYIAYRVEHDFTPMVDEIAAQIQHKVDQAALDKAACTLEQFGYVKVVRCRDCYFADEIEGGYWCYRFTCGKEPVTPNGYCKWGVRE